MGNKVTFSRTIIKQGAQELITVPKVLYDMFPAGTLVKIDMEAKRGLDGRQNN